MEADRRLSPRVVCRRGACKRLSLRVTRRRWGGVGKSHTAGADSAFRRLWKRGKLVEKAKTVSRSVIQQRTVEQIVGLPVAKVVVPQKGKLWVDAPKTMSRDRIQRRADERDDIPVSKVLEARMEKRILECIVEQIAEVLVPQMEELILERVVEQKTELSVSQTDEQFVEAPKLCFETESSSEFVSRSSTGHFGKEWRNSWRSVCVVCVRWVSVCV